MFDRLVGMSKAIKDGPASKTIRKNVRRLRGSRTYAATVREMKEVAGHAIHETVLKRIESGERRIDVDDLVGLALAFQVTPAELLLDHGDDPDELVEVSGVDEMPGMIKGAERRDVYDWLRGRRPIWFRNEGDLDEFRKRVTPAWEDPETVKAVEDVRRALLAGGSVTVADGNGELLSAGTPMSLHAVFDSAEFKQAVRRAILGD